MRNQAAEDTEDVADRGPRDLGGMAPQRTCVATRAVRPIGEMIRFVRGPDGNIVPDIKRTLPGRGVWVTAHRRSVEEAVRRRAFARGLKCDAVAAADLPDLLDRLLERSALDSLSMAHKAGLVVVGFERVQAALAEAPVTALIRARDAGAESGRKLAAALRRRLGRAADGKLIEPFASAQLDLALGRQNVVHAALLAGRASETFLERRRFLEAFRAVDPGALDPGSQTLDHHAPEPGP